MKSITLRYASVLLLAAALFGCSPPPVEAPPAAPSPTPLPTTYRSLLSPAYKILAGNNENLTNLATLAEPIATLTPLLANETPSSDRETAIRLCTIIQQGAQIALQYNERVQRPSPRTNSLLMSKNREEMQREADATDAFFQKSVLREWRSKLIPVQTAARTEWGRLSNQTTVTPSVAESYIAGQSLAVHKLAAEELHYTVVEVTSRGYLAHSFESNPLLPAPGPTGSAPAVPGALAFKDVFLQGVTGFAEGQGATVQAYRNGSYVHTDRTGAQRALERWIAISLPY